MVSRQEEGIGRMIRDGEGGEREEGGRREREGKERRERRGGGKEGGGRRKPHKTQISREKPTQKT